MVFSVITWGHHSLFFPNMKMDTDSSDLYNEILQHFITPTLNNFLLYEAWFQQDVATLLAVRKSIAAVRELFGNHVISRFGDFPLAPKSSDFPFAIFS